MEQEAKIGTYCETSVCSNRNGEKVLIVAVYADDLLLFLLYSEQNLEMRVTQGDRKFCKPEAKQGNVSKCFDEAERKSTIPLRKLVVDYNLSVEVPDGI